MKTKSIVKVLSLVLSLVLLLGMTTAITACTDEPAEEPPATHTHTYSSEWTYDETGHWHAATCEHTSEKSDYSAHDTNGADGACSVCGYKPVVEHVHTYAAEWTYDETNHWHAATCEHENEVSGLAAHTYSGNVCTVCGYTKVVESLCTCEDECVTCPTCGGCIDTSCTEEDCIKCGEDRTSNEFEVEEADLSNGLTDAIYDRASVPEIGCVYVQGLAGGNGKSIVYNINSDKDTYATLRVCCARMGDQVLFTDVMTVVINGEIFDSEGYILSGAGLSDAKRTFGYVNLGCVHLVEGLNTIEIIAFSPDPSIGVNMDKIDLMTDADVNLTWTPMDYSDLWHRKS